MSVEIAFNRPGPGATLSNLTPHIFSYDGVRCMSMEGFLQSLKYRDEQEQHRVCQLSGFQAKRYGGARRQSWATSGRGTLWWNGHPFDRDCPTYQMLLRDAYWSLCHQSLEFSRALVATGSAELTHPFGPDDIYKTVLTPREFCLILTEMRETLFDLER